MASWIPRARGGPIVRIAYGSNRWLFICFLAGLGPAMAGCADQDYDLTARYPSALTSQENFRDLARYWAPRFYQDTDNSYYVGDYLTNFNFDGDYNGKNNWENLAHYSTVPAYVYYAVSETATHWFLHYAVFHPRDWHEWLTFDRHENDLEGVTVVVRRDGSVYGALVAMETIAHDQFYQYAYAPGIRDGSDTVDGEVTVDHGHHPRVFIEAKGHGIYGCDQRCDDAPGQDGIIYEVSNVAEFPDGGDGNWHRVVGYRLIAMDADGRLDGHQGLWFRRNDICDTCTFGSWGRLRGDNYGTDKAKLAWIWDDLDDGEVFSGDMLCDPAGFFDTHLNGTPFSSGFSHTYTNHIYQTHRIEILGVRSDQNRDPFGGRSDLYVNVHAPGAAQGTNEVLNARAWKRNQASVGTWYSFAYGDRDAEGQRQYGDLRQTHSFCRPSPSPVQIRVYDRDLGDDENLGSVDMTSNYDASNGVDLGDARIQFRFNTY